MINRWLTCVALLPVVLLFAPALLPDREFALRDVTHYYRPLWQLTHRQWQQGIPLWNSLEENGRPLAADPTVAAFYPGKFIFWLPLEPNRALALFIIAHLLLSFAATYTAARWLQRSVESSLLAATAFSLCGPVIFQYTNPTFLVGASWLPLGLGLVFRVHATGSWRYASWLGVVLSLMVLGGDPQAAYLLVVLAVLWVAVSLTHRGPPDAVSLFRRIQLLAAALTMALVFSAVQLLPTWQWARDGERAYYDAPRSANELISHVAAGQPMDATGLFGIPRPGTHRAAQYQFSIGPWRWPELLWPNLGGRPFPINERWMRLIPSEGRFWTPTLYLGLVPALLGLLGLNLRSTSRPRRYLSWCVVLFGLACLGYYGIVWLINEVRNLFGVPPSGWDPVGGAYWMMSVCLPGFVSFRYPAKLFTIVALALSLLASMAADQLIQLGTKRLNKWLARYLIVTAFFALVIVIGFSPIRAVMTRGSTTIPFGPLDAEGALGGLLLTMAHGLVVVSLSVCICGARTQFDRRQIRWLVVLTASDLALAHRWLVPTVSAEAPSAIVSAMRSSSTVPCYLRWTISGWYPAGWSRHADTNRLEQVIRWDRSTVRPKYHLDHSLSAFHSSTSFSSSRHKAVLEFIATAYSRDKRRCCEALSVLGVEYVVAPLHVDLSPQFRRVPLNADLATEVNLWRNEAVYPRAWIVHQSTPLVPPRSTLWPELRAHVDAVFSLGTQLRSTVVMSKAGIGRTWTDALNDSPDESCLVSDKRAGEIHIEAKLNQQGFLVLRDSFAPGWRCYRDEDGERIEIPINRANGVMRAVYLPAGEHRLIMVYDPWTFTAGALISAIGWAGWLLSLGGSAVAWRRRAAAEH